MLFESAGGIPAASKLGWENNQLIAYSAKVVARFLLIAVWPRETAYEVRVAQLRVPLVPHHVGSL
jgi:hypothetical protein